MKVHLYVELQEIYQIGWFNVQELLDLVIVIGQAYK